MSENISDQNLSNGDQSNVAAAPTTNNEDWDCQFCKHGAKTDAPAEEPSPWWWTVCGDHSRTQKWLAKKLESRPVHITVVALVLLDLILILTDLALLSFYPIEEESPHAVHTAENTFAWISVGILSLFTLEQLIKLAVFGPSYFYRVWHALDALIIVTSLVLEILLRGPSREVVSLLIIFRLWRLVRIMHAIAEEIATEHEESAKQHHKLERKMQQRINDLEWQLQLPLSPPMRLHEKKSKNGLTNNGGTNSTSTTDVKNANDTRHLHDPHDIL
ncbi:hypothetical protein Ndes2526B_g06173 [Nannochloris sp. 'desiccata']|nr:putative Voltage-gated hydrogen channel 1 [Chlorella desiccata (nom. nud.)]